MGTINLKHIRYNLIKTTKRLTFDIVWQHPKTINKEYNGRITFTATNGYQVISCKRMDIQTERLWLNGRKEIQKSSRSGSMVFSNNADRDIAFQEFHKALYQWDEQQNYLK